MRKLFVILIIIACLGVAGFLAYSRNDAPDSQPRAGAEAGPGGRGGPGGPRAPMPVEFAPVKRGPISEHVLVVGNLIGAATVEAVPKINGRLQTVNVQLGDPVRRGQIVAKVEDREIQEQVKQAEAQFNVSRATIRQREADLKLAKTNLERNKSLLDRELLPRQTFDDTEARHQAALAQVDLAKAQFEQASSRLDELRINLGNTVIASPVDGFVGKRYLDPGAFVGPNTPVASLVDIRSVRMVANLVEKDVKRVAVGTQAAVEVDAFPGETFAGRVSRLAPVFDPATRTAEMEIEVANPGFRLKPGMYARVQLKVASRNEALTVPSNALVMVGGKQGVFTAAENAPARGDARPAAQPGPGATLVAKFIPVETGIREAQQVEILGGLADGTQVVTTGAGALKDGDRIVAASGDTGRGGRGTAQGPGSTR
jgi:RND family efflux transporter MFP subunit